MAITKQGGEGTKDFMVCSIQILRCVAATLVVLAHCGLSAYEVPQAITGLGGIGVDIFFIVSGFIMPYVVFDGLYHEKSTLAVNSVTFFIRRLARIWPLYFLVTVIILILSVFVSKFLHPDADLAYAYSPHKLSLVWLFESLTFTHWHRPPLLSIGWTLQLEFAFYTFFAAVIAIKRIKIDLIEVGFGLFVLISNIIVNANVTSGLVHYLPFLVVFSQPMMCEFLFGMILYRFYSYNIVLPAKLSVFILMFALPVFCFFVPNRFLGIFELNFSINR